MRMLSSLVTLFVFLQIGTGCASLSINHKKQILVIIKIRLDSFIPHTNTKAFYLKEKQSISFSAHSIVFVFVVNIITDKTRKTEKLLHAYHILFRHSINLSKN